MYALSFILLNAVVDRIRGVNKRKALKKDFILCPVWAIWGSYLEGSMSIWVIEEIKEEIKMQFGGI